MGIIFASDFTDKPYTHAGVITGSPVRLTLYCLIFITEYSFTEIFKAARAAN